MNQTQRQRIKKHQQQLKAAAALKKQRRNKQVAQQAAQQAAQQVKRKQLKNRRAGLSTNNPLSVPDDIKAEEFNRECFIVGGGPSLIGFDWSNLDGKFCIAINRAYEVLPNAQIVYFTDDDYYQRHRKEMLKHTGKKYRGRLAKKVVIKDPEVLELQLQQRPFGWSDQFGELHHGSNSSYACIQVAGQLGFKKIYLLGVDMKHQGKYDRKKKNNEGVTHWHNGHRRTDPASAYKMMIGHYKKLAPEAKKRGIEIININNNTNLDAFPIKTVEEIFNS